jgi:hydrogenase maturation protease
MLSPLPLPARVVGLGNVLLGDDGFGPLVIERFRAEYECDPNVEVLDLGTPGLDLVPYLQDAALVVIVDAVNAAGNPGSLHLYAEDQLLNHRDALCFGLRP